MVQANTGDQWSNIVWSKMWHLRANREKPDTENGYQTPAGDNLGFTRKNYNLE